MLSMKPGDAASKYVEEHTNDIDPETGKAPVILAELADEMLEGNLPAADEMLHNYLTHDIIESGTSNCGPACARERETG